MSPRSEEEINAEKAMQPDRPDLVPVRAILAAGRAFAVGAAKHGTPNGRGTYRIAGTEQADPATHIASFERHWMKWRSGVLVDGSGLSHLDHAMAQLAIIVDLIEDPPVAP